MTIETNPISQPSHHSISLRMPPFPIKCLDDSQYLFVYDTKWSCFSFLSYWELKIEIVTLLLKKCQEIILKALPVTQKSLTKKQYQIKIDAKMNQISFLWFEELENNIYVGWEFNKLFRLMLRLILNLF